MTEGLTTIEQRIEDRVFDTILEFNYCDLYAN